MKKTGIILSIAGALLVVGLIIGSIGFVMGGRNGFYVDMTGVHSYGEIPRKTDTKEVSAFSNISLRFPSGDVSLVESDHFAVAYDIDGSYEIKQMEVSGDTLNVEIEFVSKLRFFNFDLSGFSHPSDFIKIYYPAGTQLDETSFHISSGSLDGQDVKASRIVADLSSGECNLRTVTAGSVEADVTSGSVYLENVKLKQLDAHCSSGEIAVRNATVEGDAKLSSTSGNITLQNVDAGTMDTELSSGHMAIDGIRTGQLQGRITSGGLRGVGVVTGGINFKSSSGDIHLGGTMLGENKIRVTSGSVKIDNSAAEDGFSYTLDAISGTTRVNGNKSSGHTNVGAVNVFDIHASSGNVDLNFASSGSGTDSDDEEAYFDDEE